MKDIPLIYEPRTNQLDALEHFKKAIGDDKKFIIANMPVGTGKSYYAIMLSHWYNYNINETKFTLLTNSIQLQNQYMADFPFIRDLKGQSNYSCNTYSVQCDKGKILCKASNNECTNCPHKEAVELFTADKMSLANYHVFSKLKNPRGGVLIIDEAHTFEKTYCSILTSTISAKTLQYLGIDSRTANRIIDDAKVMLPDNVQEWIKELLGILSDQLADALGSINKKATKTLDKVTDIQSLIESLKAFDEKYAYSKKNWIIEAKADGLGEVTVSIKPIWTSSYLKKIWEKYDKVVFMSGTIDYKKTVEECGLDIKETYFFEQQSPFPIDSRPIKIINLGAMNYNNKEAIFTKQKVYLEKIFKKHALQKGLVHTNTYQISGWIKEAFIKEPRILSHSSAKTKSDILLEHSTSTEPTIVISPSMTTGVDFKDDLSRFQVIMKVPYPNLGDSWVKARKESSKTWYISEAVAEIVQAYGRSIRSESDWAVTYILDGSIVNLIEKNSHMFPQYFLEACQVANG